MKPTADDDRKANYLRLKTLTGLMRAKGWAMRSWTKSGTWKPVRFTLDKAWNEQWSIKSTGIGGKWYRLELWTGRYFYPTGSRNMQVPIYTPIITPVFQSPLALALWFELIYPTLYAPHMKEMLKNVQSMPTSTYKAKAKRPALRDQGKPGVPVASEGRPVA